MKKFVFWLLFVPLAIIAIVMGCAGLAVFAALLGLVAFGLIVGILLLAVGVLPLLGWCGLFDERLNALKNWTRPGKN